MKHISEFCGSRETVKFLFQEYFHFQWRSRCTKRRGSPRSPLRCIHTKEPTNSKRVYPSADVLWPSCSEEIGMLRPFRSEVFRQKYSTRAAFFRTNPGPYGSREISVQSISWRLELPLEREELVRRGSLIAERHFGDWKTLKSTFPFELLSAFDGND